MSRRLRCALRAAALALAATWAAAGARAAQWVDVPSLDTTPPGSPLTLPGFWFPSLGPEPRPALVLLHGCAGPYGAGGRQLSRHLLDYAAWLNAMGVHVLVTDSLSPRGERELCTQRLAQRKVTQTQRRRDALGALQWLALQPGVDAKRLGLAGWSHGGSTVLAATDLTHAEVQRAPVAPSLAVAFYPGCSAALSSGYRAAAPLLLQVGEDDDWTAAEPCRRLAQSTPVASDTAAPIQFYAYAGAGHGFDSTQVLRRRSDVPNGVRRGQGVHVGGHPEARALSRERLHRFLAQAWALPPPPLQ